MKNKSLTPSMPAQKKIYVLASVGFAASLFLSTTMVGLVVKWLLHS